MRNVCHLLAVLSCGCLLINAAAAQEATPTTQPTTAEPTTQPAERETITARVIEVIGDVQAADLDGEAWRAIELDDELPPETQIRTGLRSALKLQIGSEEPYTVMVIDSVGKVVLSEAYRTPETKRVRVGVGYGRIRAGVAEGGRASDFSVDTPVATLSKRGTWNFGIAYDRGTDRFEAFLLDRGLVDVLNKLRKEQRTLLPGQLVTDAMRRWANEVQIRRNVPMVDILGQEDFQIAFNRLRNSGLGVVNPSGGREILIDLSSPAARDLFGSLAEGALAANVARGGLNFNLNQAIRRPEGFFGTGRGDQLVDVLIDANNQLVQQGKARAGRYTFRRAALEGWLQSRNR